MKVRPLTMFLFTLFSFSCFLALVQGGPEEDFANMDTNKDGRISKDEYTTFHIEWSRKRRMEAFNKVDTDKDGKLTTNEFMASMQKKAREAIKMKVFNEMDADRDGKVTGDEFILSQKKWRLQIVTNRAEIVFNKADVDSDGVINLAEFKDAINAINAFKEKLGQLRD